MKQLFFSFFLTALSCAVPVVASDVSFDVFKDADVVFLGEVHDNPMHHDTQVQALLAIEPKAVVFEMLVPTQAAKITDGLLDDGAALETALGWNASGWPDFSMYYPLFAVLDGARFYGAQVPREATRVAFEGGDMARLLDGEGDKFGLTVPLPVAQQAEREALQMAAHCDALPEAMLPGMVMAQRLRDARLAQAVTQALMDTGGPVTVITGNGHARTDWGAPTLLADDVLSLSLGQFEAEPEGEQPFDIWFVTEPAERDDPCEAFKK